MKEMIIRHRAEGRSGVTSSVESFIHSFSSTSFQVEPPASGLSSLQVELQPLPLEFLKGVHGDALLFLAWIPPPFRAPHFAILPHLGALGRYLGSSWRSQAASCRQVAPRWRGDGPT